MNTTDTAAFFDFITQRARSAGRDAYLKGDCCKAPAIFGDYAFNWTEGWTQAALDAARQKKAA